MPQLTSAQVLAYHERRARVQEALAQLPRGTQQDISYDIRKPATIVSLVLNGRYMQEETLSLIEGWFAQRHPHLLREAAVAIPA